MLVSSLKSDHVVLFRRYGVNKIYKMEEGLKPSNSQRIFLVSNNLIACKRVLDQIQSEISYVSKPNVEICHHLLVMPFVPAVLHNLVEEEGQHTSFVNIIIYLIFLLIIMLSYLLRFVWTSYITDAISGIYKIRWKCFVIRKSNVH